MGSGSGMLDNSMGQTSSESLKPNKIQNGTNGHSNGLSNGHSNGVANGQVCLCAYFSVRVGRVGVGVRAGTHLNACAGIKMCAGNRDHFKAQRASSQCRHGGA